MGAGNWANRLASLTSSYKEVQFRKFCTPVETVALLLKTLMKSLADRYY